METENEIHNLYKILTKLEEASIYYELGRYADNTITISARVVGARIEIEVFDDGEIQTSIFKGDESVVGGMEEVERIIADNKE